MRDELLAYLLNDLEPQQRTRIEERLNSDPIWQHELERLRSYVDEAHDASLDQTGVEQADPFQNSIVQNSTDETGADNTTAGKSGVGMADSPPADLVNRTCLFVKQASAQGALSPAVLPASLSEAHDAAAPRSKRWSLLDLAIVASIFVVLGTLLLPALRESRDSARRVQCQEKLHELGRKLATYAGRTGAGQSGGRLPAIERNENAGMFAVKLVESGLLTEEQLVELLVCPSSKLAEKVFNGEVVLRVPNRREMHSATVAQLRSLVETMGGSFAYRIGYFDKLGNYRQIAFTGSRNSPIMADKPSYDVVGFQSPHHTGCQANVLFQDQSVRIIKFCMQNGKDRHWFLNEDQQAAAGKNELDIVLGRSETTPIGNTLLRKSIRLQRRPANNFANGSH